VWRASPGARARPDAFRAGVRGACRGACRYASGIEREPASRRHGALRVRLAAVAVLLGAGAAGALLLRGEPPPREPEQLCSVFREKPHWYRGASRASARWGASVPALMAVMLQESSLDGSARPQRRRLLGFIPWSRPSTATGYAQVVDATWRQYERRAGGEPRRDDFADAADFVAWYLTEVGQILVLPSRDMRRLYLAYHEGPTGYRRGSYRAHPRLEAAARRVAERAQRYRLQLESCRDDLDAMLWWRAFRSGALSVLAALAALGALGAWLLRLHRRRGSRARPEPYAPGAGPRSAR
jgi:hypothetical protein